MTGIPRPVVATAKPCPVCGAALTITFDALNRPRHRCATCHGIVTTPIDAGTVARVAVPEPGLEHVAPSREQLNRLRQTPRPVYGPGHPARAAARAQTQTPAPPERRCDRCGAVLPAQARGRPRLRCEDKRACHARTPEAA